MKCKYMSSITYCFRVFKEKQKTHNDKIYDANGQRYITLVKNTPSPHITHITNGVVARKAHSLDGASSNSVLPRCALLSRP